MNEMTWQEVTWREVSFVEVVLRETDASVATVTLGGQHVILGGEYASW